MSRFWPYALLLVGLLPFLGKAYHIDDPVFLTIADRIRHAPTRPYDVTLNRSSPARLCRPCRGDRRGPRSMTFRRPGVQEPGRDPAWEGNA